MSKSRRASMARRVTSRLDLFDMSSKRRSPGSGTLVHRAHMLFIKVKVKPLVLGRFAVVRYTSRCLKPTARWKA